MDFKFGKIVVAYYGVAPKLYPMQHKDVVVLDSDCFFVNGEMCKNWHVAVANLAVDIARQGKIVVLPFHKELRELFNKNGTPFTVVCPSLELREQWIKRLERFYVEYQDEGSYNRWQASVEQYNEDISDLMKEYNVKVIGDIAEYNFYDIVVYGVKTSLKKDVFGMFDDLVLTKNGFVKKEKPDSE